MKNKFQSSNTQKTTNPCTEVDIEKYTQPFISAKTLSYNRIKHLGLAEFVNSELKKRSEPLSSEDLQEKTPELSDEYISEKPLDDKVLKHLSEMEQIEDRKDVTDRLLVSFQTSLIGYFLLVVLLFFAPEEKLIIKDMAPLIINSQTPLVYLVLGYYFGKKE
ncbi:MAG: hypothetical protein WBA93_09235 [Microcoleaceae cyanobacterium]